jgi:voltage-dependent calcium channel L type alpha-1D
MLACTDYNDRLYNDYVSIDNLNMAQVDTAFSIIFLVECILKVLAMGFVLHSNSYMRDRWNWLDIFVVSISVVTWLPGIEGNASLKSLRTFRILRPLRSINSLPSMKALILSLLSSMPGLFNVGIFLAFIFTIFAIFGMHQFTGQQYSRCRMTEKPTLIFNSTEYEWPINYDAAYLCNVDEDCARQLGDGVVAKCGQLQDYGIPLAQDKPDQDPLIFYDIVNFNNLGRSLYTVFQCLTLESWTLIMYNYMDCNNYWISAGYFCFMVIFGSFFAMQLVLANIMDSFARD